MLGSSMGRTFGSLSISYPAVTVTVRRVGSTVAQLRMGVSSILVVLLACSVSGLIATPAFAGTAEEVNVLPTIDALNRSESPLSNSGKWGALSWDTSASSHNTGQDTASGWGPYDAFSTVNGAYWTPATFNDVSGDAASVTMNTSPGNVERYVSLWLDMPSPASAKTGYQLRWTMTNVASNTYSVTLSKWSAATQTVLASNASVTIAPGTTLAISDSGATVSAWQSSGGTFSSLLSVTDSTFSGGYAGIEGSGNISRSSNFKAGLLVGPAIGTTSVLDNLERNEHPFPSGSKWSKTSWAESVGGAWGSPYRGYGGGGLSGAYWNPGSFSDGGETVLSAATVGTGAPYAGEYLAFWLDMPNPGSERSGYEARFTGTNGTATAYQVELSKWVAGTRTVLASTSGFSLPVGTTIALTETAGGTLALWSGSGASMTPVLKGSDSTYTGGYAGLEVKGGAGTLYNFRGGQVFNQPPDTSITAGPKGNVAPNVAFSFSSNKTGTSFECSLDGAAYSACTSPKPYSSLSEGTHTFKVRAIGPGGKDETPAERSFQAIAPAKATSKVAVLDNLERVEHPFSAGSKWSKTSWAEAIGGAWGSPYRGYGGTGLSGAYWNPGSFSDGGETQLVAATVGTGAMPTGQYLGLWLDMPSPGSERSGYEARFTGTNGTATAYQVELSKWAAGTRTVLGSTSGFSLPVGTTIALSETTGGTITLWTGTSSSMTQTLTASDSTYTSGYAGLEVNGGAGTLYNFRAGALDLTAPNTTIQSGPSGVVLPEGVSFAFTASETGATFECSLDGAAYVVCSSPQPYPGLVSGSSHTFRVRAVDAVGNQDETPAERSFRVVLPPGVTTNAASGVKSSEATLQASVNPNGAETTYQFEYGTTTSYGSKAPATATSLGSGTTSMEVSQPIAGLTPGATYHFRISATNAAGTSRGEDRTFTTPMPPPVAITEEATNVEGTQAELHGAINPNGESTSYRFEYGATTSYGAGVPVSPENVGAAREAGDVETIVEGLTPNTTYHFRVAATSATGTAYGSDQTLTTGERSTSEEGAEPWQGSGTGGQTGTEGPYTSVVRNSSAPGDFTFGVQFHNRIEDEAPTEANAIHEYGAEMLRINFDPVTGNTTEVVNRYRNLFTVYAKRGITILPTLYWRPLPEPGTPSWTKAREGTEALLQTYGPGGSFWASHKTGEDALPNKAPVWWEVWNEPNRGYNSPNGHTLQPGKFGEFLHMMSNAIHSSSGNQAKVLLGGLLSIPTEAEVKNPETGALESQDSPWDFLHAIGGYKEDYDGVGVHPYAFTYDGEHAPTTAEQVLQEAEKVKRNIHLAHDAVAAVNATDKPLWITELGWPTGKPGDWPAQDTFPPVTEEIQASLLNKTFDMIKSFAKPFNVHALIYFNDREYYENGEWPGFCGLRTAAGKWREVVGAYENQTGAHPWPRKPTAYVSGVVPKSRHASIRSRIGTEDVRTWYRLEYVTDSEYKAETKHFEHPQSGSTQEAGYEGEVEVDTELAGLKPATEYHYRIVATNENGEVTDGAEGEFKTELSTETFATVTSHNGRPGWVTVEGHVLGEHSLTGDYVNINFQKKENGKFVFNEQQSTHANIENNYYKLEKKPIGEGEWKVVVVFPGFGEDLRSESSEHGEHEFTIQAIPTETFLTLNSYTNGTPGTASVSGNVQHNGVGISGTVNVNFQKLVGGTWQTMSTAQRVLSNGHYEVLNWGVGVGQWRVRAVFPDQEEYAGSESEYHEFSLSPVPTESFLTVNQVVKGKPGNVSVSGNVLHNGAGVPGYVNVNFEKWNGSAWQTMSTAQPGLSNGHYEVLNWGVGAGSWRVRVVFPEQGEYLGSMSEYHEFAI